MHFILFYLNCKFLHSIVFSVFSCFIVQAKVRKESSVFSPRLLWCCLIVFIWCQSQDLQLLLIVQIWRSAQFLCLIFDAVWRSYVMTFLLLSWYAEKSMGTRKYKESWNIHFEGSGIIGMKCTLIDMFIFLSFFFLSKFLFEIYISCC